MIPTNHIGLLYRRLDEEINLEIGFKSDRSANVYLKNLKTIKAKETPSYVKRKHNRRIRHSQLKYNDFVDRFRHEVTETLGAYGL